MRVPSLTDDLLAFPRLLRRTSVHLVAAPCRWSPRDWTLFFAVLAATLFAYAEKGPLQALVEQPRCGTLLRIARFTETVGDGGAAVCYGVTAFVVGRWSKCRAAVDLALTLATGGFWCSMLTKAGQFVLAEARPSDGGMMRFLARDGHGVSGHASAVALVCVATCNILTRDTRPAIRRAGCAGVRVWALIVGWSRIYLGAHFVWNVVLGFAIGAFTASIAARTCIASGTRSERSPS